MSYSSGSSSLPLGVAILAVLIGIFAVFLIVLSVLLFLFTGLAVPHSAAFFGVSLIGELFLFILGIILLVVATGLWDRELWALVLSIIVLGLLLIGDLVNGTLLTLGGIITVLLIVYLVAVHNHFH
jgi:hypothetical protein